MEDHIQPPDPGFGEEKGPPEYPRVFEVNEDLHLKVGYRDSRMVVTYNTGLPLVGRVNLTLDPPDIPLVERVIARQKELKGLRESWQAIPEAKRKKIKPEEIRLSKRTVARVGFADDHVEITATLLLSYTIPIKDKEAPAVEEALKFSKEWNEKPEVERFLQGAE
jgi:hypothetical protein